MPPPDGTYATSVPYEKPQEQPKINSGTYRNGDKCTTMTRSAIDMAPLRCIPAPSSPGADSMTRPAFPFGSNARVRYRGLVKHIAQLTMRFSLSN